MSCCLYGWHDLRWQCDGMFLPGLMKLRAGFVDIIRFWTEEEKDQFIEERSFAITWDDKIVSSD